ASSVLSLIHSAATTRLSSFPTRRSSDLTLTKITHFTDQQTRLEEDLNVKCLCEDVEGRLWIGGLYGLLRFDEPTGELTTVFRLDQVKTVMQDRAGILYFAYAYLNRFQDGRLKFSARPAGQVPQAINHLVESSDGALWMSTD